jgi:hypothetical protein
LVKPRRFLYLVKSCRSLCLTRSTYSSAGQFLQPSVALLQPHAKSLPWTPSSSSRFLSAATASSTVRVQFRQANFRLATNINNSFIFSSDPFHWCTGSSPLPSSSRS